MGKILEKKPKWKLKKPKCHSSPSTPSSPSELTPQVTEPPIPVISFATLVRLLDLADMSSRRQHFVFLPLPHEIPESEIRVEFQEIPESEIRVGFQEIPESEIRVGFQLQSDEDHVVRPSPDSWESAPDNENQFLAQSDDVPYSPTLDTASSSSEESLILLGENEVSLGILQPSDLPQVRLIDDPRYKAVLALTWKPGYLIGKLGTKYDNFRDRQLCGDRTTVVCTIHGVFFYGPRGSVRHGPNGSSRPRTNYYAKDDKNLRAKTYSKLRDYLKENPKNVFVLHKYWSSFSNWQQLGDEHRFVYDDEIWENRKWEFRLIVDEFIRHGPGMAMDLDEYIDHTLMLFGMVDPVKLFRRSGVYPCYEGFSAVSPFDDLKNQLTVQQLIDSFVSSSLVIPKLEFTYYEGPGDSFLCSLSEIKVLFDSKNEMMDFELCECDCAGQKVSVASNHKVSVLTHWDRRFISQ